MADKNAEIDPKLAHSIIYAQSTSEIKDDIPALCDSLRLGKVLLRIEAGFLLWYHALSSHDKRVEMVESRGDAACLYVLADKAATPAEQSVALGILEALASDEEDEVTDAVGASKAPGSGLFCIQVVGGIIPKGTETQALSASVVLRKLSDKPTSRKPLLRELPNITAHLRSLKTFSSEKFAANTLFFLANCAGDKPEVLEELVRCDALSYALETLQATSDEHTVTASLTLINRLCQHPGMGAEVVRRGAVPILVDVLGEPAPKPNPPLPGEESSIAVIGLDGQPSAMSLGSGPSTFNVSGGASSPSRAPPKKDRHPGGPRLKSGYDHSVASLGAVGAILWHIAQLDEGRAALTKNSGSFRLCTAVKKVIEYVEDDGKKGKKGGGKKGKKGKGIVLSPTQEAAVNELTGAMRHLSLVDTNKIRIARFGGMLKMLASLYEGSTKASIRWNARGILSNVSTMAVNEEVMKVEGVPEEFGGLANLAIDAEMDLELSELPL